MNKNQIQELVQGLRKRERKSIARLISKVENRDSEFPEIISNLFPYTGKAHVIGITGPPGAGKSTLVDTLINEFRAENKRVAVIAIDPSSPFSGGAVLGDRIRMQKHSKDSDVFIRSLGTRGKQGGLSFATKEVVLVLDAAGYDTILVETAGVGQTELGILKLAQTVVVVLVPESGDAIQVMKAGLMEIADIFVVNKSDRPESEKLVKELIQLVELDHRASSWNSPIHKTEAVRGKGIKELFSAIKTHFDYLQNSGKIKSKREELLIQEVIDIIGEKLQLQIKDFLTSPHGSPLLNDLFLRKLDPYHVSKSILSQFRQISK